MSKLTQIQPITDQLARLAELQRTTIAELADENEQLRRGLEHANRTVEGLMKRLERPAVEPCPSWFVRIRIFG